MSGTTYLSAAVLKHVGQAQAELNQHLTTRLDGRCLVCGGLEPCQPRQIAEQTLARYGRLPVRVPGLASGVRDTDGFEWFHGGTDGTT